MRNIVNFSGGKDSMATILIMMDRGINIDEIVFADTGLEFIMTYEYLEKVESFLGKKIIRVKNEVETYMSLFLKKRIKGDYIGQINAFPLAGACNVFAYLKRAPLRKYFRVQKDYVSFIGICVDEKKRYNRLGKNERSVLYEYGLTQMESLNIVKESGLINPLYDYFNRLGCWMCPQKSINEFRVMRKCFKSEWSKLKCFGKLAEKYAVNRRFAEFKPGWTVSELDEYFEEEDKQINIFDSLVLTSQ